MELDDFLSFQPSDPATAPPCGIFVDGEGDWFHQGNRIFREEILELFYAHLHYHPDGHFLIEWRGSRCVLDVADTPFVIGSVERTQATQTLPEQILLRLRHLPDAEPLDPSTLRVGRENVLGCRIRDGKVPARFSRPAYYALARWIEEDPQSGCFFIPLNGVRYDILEVG